MSALSRYWEIYRVMWRNSLIREMNFKINFLLWMIVELLWFMGQIVFINVLFGYVDRIGDWTKWEVVLLVGTHQIIGQLFQAFFFVNVSNLPELVRTGRLDILLSQPVDAQFAVCTRQFGLDSVVNALVGVAIVIFALAQLRITPGPWQIGLYCIAIACGVAIHYAVMFGLATVSFWIVRAQGLIHGYFNLFNIARYPRAIFSGVFRWVFSWIIPVLVVANIPAEMLVRPFAHPALGLLQLVGAAFIVVFGTRLFWKFALRRYSSASS